MCRLFGNVLQFYGLFLHMTVPNPNINHAINKEDTPDDKKKQKHNNVVYLNRLRQLLLVLY